ncbi:hypothetical protein GGR51DRAFT_70600 [Nemania sp. FL0031]|nr:hypothetical protein GGR51DRAFT_70600 [Nemania sp. FL0031]
MDEKHALGLAPRGIRYDNTGREVSLPIQSPIDRDEDEDEARASGDYRNYHGPKYSNNNNTNSSTTKNWNQQQHPLPHQLQQLQFQQLQYLGQNQNQNPGLTTVRPPPSRTLSQVYLHPQSDLVGPIRQLQLDPSQSHQQQQEAASAAAATHATHHQHHRSQSSQNQSQSQLGHHQGLVFPSSPSPFQQSQQSQHQQHPYHHPHTHPHTHAHVHLAQARQHQRSSSQPPRLPPLAVSLSAISLSPFDLSDTRDGDNNNNNYSLSFAASPTPATSSNSILAIPRLPVQADEIVSPISETRSSTPIFRSLDRGDEPPIAHFHSPPAVAQPFSRFASSPAALHRQPTTHSSAGASLLDDKDFERSLGVIGRIEYPAVSPSHSTAAALSSAVAHDVAHLTDEKSDDWFRFTARESAISSGSNSRREAHQSMATVAMTGDGWSASEHQHPHPHSHPHPHHQQQQQHPQHQEQQQQQQGDQFTTTRSSFTPLPPIRRTSTFGLLRNKGLTDDDNSDAAPSPIEPDIPPVPPVPTETAQQTSNGQLSAGQAASHSSPHNSMQPQSQPQQNVNLNLNANPNLHGHIQPAMPQHPNGHAAAVPVGQPGMPPQQPIMQMSPHPMMMGRGGPPGQQVVPGHMMINNQNQPALAYPSRGQWTEQVSTLAEPLNSSNRNRSANGPRAYTAYDKEIEGPAPPPQHFGGIPPQTRPRNASNPVPPTAAAPGYPAIFSGFAGQHAFQRNQGQVPLPQHLHQRVQNGNTRPRNSFDDASMAKELGGPSIVSEEGNDKRRISEVLFPKGHRRNSSNAIPQGSTDGAPEKKKTNFFASVAGIGHSHAKPKSNLGIVKPTTIDNSDQVSLRREDDGPAPTPGKLSELKGMIKGVGNAKEGAKDDYPGKVEPIYESRQSIQSPPRTIAPPPGNQAPQRHPGPFVPPVSPGLFGPQAQARPPGPLGPMQPHPSQMGQPMVTGPASFMGVGRASTSGPQLGNIQQVKSEESGKKASGGFLGGLFNKQGKKTKDAKPQSPQQMPPSSQQSTQPSTQYMSLRPGQMQQPGPHPMFAGQPRPPGQTPSPTSSQDPTQPSPSLETARMVAMRRPSEITVSSQGQSFKSPAGSQNTFRQQAPSPLGQRPGQMGLQNDGSIVASQTSPRLSTDSALERPSIGNAPAIPRFSPNRKPVGSGTSKANGPFMTSAVSPDLMGPNHSATSPSPIPGDQPPSSQVSPAQQNPQPGSFRGYNDIRNPSLTSPEPSPVPSQSNYSSSPRLQGDQFARDPPNPRESGQGLGVFPNGLSSSGPMNPPGPGGLPNSSTWGSNGARPSVPPLTAPSAAARARLPTPSSPVPSVDQGKLSKFFGAYDGGKPAAQPQVHQATKEKSAASKFLGAFKRSSKQSETPSPQPTPQIPQGETPAPGDPSRPSGVPPRQPQIPPIQLGQGRGQIAMQQMQAGRGQVPPQGMPVLAQVGRGQIPPGMVLQGGRGQMPPPMFGGTGPIPPQIQRPPASGKQGPEPLYDQVPIPQGYEAVHGYGPGGMLAPSPYNAGRPGQSPVQYMQYPPGAQPGFPQRQWDPRMTGFPPGAAPSGSQVMPQGVPRNIPYQGAPQQLQLQGPPQNAFAPPQTSPQRQIPPQQFTQPPSTQQPSQLSPQGQGQASVQVVQGSQLQQPHSQGEGFRRESTADSQIQPNSWTSTPQMTHSSTSVQQTNPSTPNPVIQPSVRSISISDSNTSNGTPPLQPQQMTFAAPSQSSQLTQPNSTNQHSPINYLANPSAQQTVSQAQQEAGRPPTHSPSTISNTTAASSGPVRLSDATRLTSRMSVSNHGTRSNASFGSDKPTDRTLTVSPEPPGPRHEPIHQVSEQNLSVNVERANNHVRHASEDIYDATPRLNSSTPQGQPQAEDPAHENTKYAGSEKGRAVTNGVGIGIGIGVGVGVGVGARDAAAAAVAEDNMSFLDGPDDSESDENQGSIAEEPNMPPQAIPANMNAHMEPEEKILVDQPVELAAVNDDDDGLPMMTATSYPGQEWNPYGAGEFGDYE